MTDPGEAGVSLCERPFRGQLALRGDCQDPAFVKGVQQALGVNVPAESNTVSKKKGVSALWLGPDEWLIVLPDGRDEAATEKLRKALSGQHVAVSNVSDSRIIIGMSGPYARDVLMKGCSIDLHPRAFGPGQCAQTGLARCHMLLHQLDKVPTYDVYVHRSFADYVWRWLTDAAAEYELAIVASKPAVSNAISAEKLNAQLNPKT